MRVIVNPPENDPPLVIDPDRVEAFQVAPQLFQPIRGWHPEVLQSRRGMERLELPFCPARHPLKVPHSSVAEQPLTALVPKGFDHGADYTEYRDTVKPVGIRSSSS